MRLSPCHRSRSRRGFTLIELLVAMGVIGALIGLLGPAVQRARESARRLQCSTRLRDLALASHNFHEVHQTLPPQGRHRVDEVRFPRRLSAWARLLPFLGHDTIHGQIDDRESGPTSHVQPPESTHNDHLLKLTVKEFVCPSERLRIGMCNYRVCEGSHPDLAPPSQRGAYWGRGRSGRNCPLSAITDGLSNTVLCSEKIVGDYGPERFNVVGDTWDMERAWILTDADAWAALCAAPPSLLPSHSSFGGATWLFSGKAYTVYNHVLPPNSPILDCTQQLDDLDQSATTARSWHTGGVNVAMADGAARFVSENVDLKVWRAVGTRAGNETVGDW